MKFVIKKIYAMLALLLIPAIGYGYEDNPLDCQESASCVDCEMPSDCQPVCSCSCPAGFISVDLLYWRAFEGGLDRCVPDLVSDTVTGGRIISRFSGRGRNPHFRWDPGFRIAVGYELACDWDIVGSWTHFNSHAHDTLNGNELRWNLNFDVIDIVARYEFEFPSCITLSPFAGLRGARIDQELSISVVSPSIININNKENFLGIGPLVGLGADWDIGCGLSLYTSASLSWLYGHFDLTLIESEESLAISSFSEISKDLDATVGVADVALGIRWQTCIWRGTPVTVQLGLEHHHYFDYNRIGGYGDLSFDGLTFSVGVGF